MLESLLRAIFILLYSVNAQCQPYGNQPRLLRENGHLYIVSGSDRNITLRTSGHGYININNENLQITHMTRSASGTVESFKKDILSSVEQKIQRLMNIVEGPNGLVRKTVSIENTLNNASAPAGGSYSQLRVRILINKGQHSDLHTYDHSRSSSFNFTFTYKTSACGGLLSGPENVITSPDYPGSYPANVDCAWRVEVDVGQTITVKFEVMDLEPDCDHDFLSLYNGMLPTYPHIGKFCGNVIPANITTQYNYVWIEFHSDAAIQHSGFKIIVTANNQGCGGILGGKHGNINSPGFPGQYPVNVECEWEIKVQPGFHLVLNFVSRFHLETSVNCEKDYVQVFDYKDGMWIRMKRVCGKHFPDPINSTSNVMKLLFHSDNKTVGDGFVASWSVNCGSVISVNGEGVIISPNYPEGYLPNLYCNYTLLAPSEFMNGEFTSFNMEGDVAGKCIYDNVTVYTNPIPNSLFDYEYDDHEKQVTYCGSDLPPKIRSKVRITLVFQTDGWTKGQGFFFKYNVERCHQNITKPTVISLGDSGSYGHSQNCSWLITAPTDRIIILRIQNFMLEGGSNCQFDYLDIYDGLPNKNDSRHVGKFCGTSIPSRIRSTKNHMFLRFVSDVSVSTEGFSISVTYSFGEGSGCGGTQDISPNVPLIITSLDADHDGNYEPFLECSWFIKAPLSHVLSIQIDKLDIDNCNNSQNASCHCDYVALYDGVDKKSILIGKYCGNLLVPNIWTSTNQLYAQFISDGTSNKPGFRLTIKAEISPCGPAFFNVSMESKTLTSPGYPANYPNNIRCRWTLYTSSIMDMIRLHFTDFDMEISEKCSHDYLIISNLENYRLAGTNNRLQLTRGRSTKLCGKRANDYVSTTSIVRIEFYSNSQRTGKGFQLTYSMPGCNFNYTEPQGRIVSQRLSRTCTIRITATSENATVSLYFTYFLLLSHDECQTTKMRIFDGPSENSPVIASLCGPQTADPIFSSGPALYILINSVFEFGRYDMSYTTTDQGRGCGGQLLDFEGTFTSQLYPTVYRNSSVCRWQITVPHGYGMSLNFLVFNLASKSLCTTDHIKFYEIGDETGTETFHSQLCGGETPATQTFTSSSVSVNYVTSEHNTGRGWVIHYRAYIVDEV